LPLIVSLNQLAKCDDCTFVNFPKLSAGAHEWSCYLLEKARIRIRMMGGVVVGMKTHKLIWLSDALCSPCLVIAAAKLVGNNHLSCKVHPPHADERKRDFFDARRRRASERSCYYCTRTHRKQPERERIPLVLSMFIWADELLGNILRFAAAASAARSPCALIISLTLCTYKVHDSALRAQISRERGRETRQTKGPPHR
jgi:hypothetical protein